MVSELTTGLLAVASTGWTSFANELEPWSLSEDAEEYSDFGVWALFLVEYNRRTRITQMTICGKRQRQKYAPHTPLPAASPPSGPSAGPNAPIPAPTKLMEFTVAEIKIVVVLLRIKATSMEIGFAISSPTIRHPITIPRLECSSIFCVVHQIYDTTRGNCPYDTARGIRRDKCRPEVQTSSAVAVKRRETIPVYRPPAFPQENSSDIPFNLTRGFKERGRPARILFPHPQCGQHFGS